MKRLLFFVLISSLAIISLADDIKDRYVAVYHLSNGKTYMSAVSSIDSIDFMELVDVESFVPDTILIKEQIHDTIEVQVHDTIEVLVHDTIVIDKNLPTFPKEEDHEYVDLGLPSGTMWARTNLGATNVYDQGLLFAWGETASKEVSDWSNYAHCEGTSELLTKYNTDWRYGEYLDNKTQLDLEDDAAYMNWGGDWRIPTSEQWKELFDVCQHTYTSVNKVAGLRFYNSETNTSIFIPMTYEDDQANRYGDYWMSSLFSKPIEAYCAEMCRYHSGSTAAHCNVTRSRTKLLPIRPVCKKNLTTEE